MTRVLVVDDHDFFRTCMVDLVASTADLRAVGECRDGTEVLDAVRVLRPDVVLMDVRMRTRTGLEAAADLRRAGDGARVILLSSDPVHRHRRAAEREGVAGYLMKDADASRVLEAIRRVASGGTAWPEERLAG
ncbi:response regulator [Microlunatus flavus]|uniref:Two-component system, NarL family, response regulator n=1 Tax=Microlunatus flavus TaxID=1036181 RepID=A0A1H9J7S7_9ACTN|nr:response regulator transcription factor [Microlunatus flavus]SEQ82848.1 two-component system, NarL family, response regulator [Microlunatus flavus]